MTIPHRKRPHLHHFQLAAYSQQAQLHRQSAQGIDDVAWLDILSSSNGFCGGLSADLTLSMQHGPILQLLDRSRFHSLREESRVSGFGQLLLVGEIHRAIPETPAEVLPWRPEIRDQHNAQAREVCTSLQ
jgi:hypothetical protein